MTEINCISEAKAILRNYHALVERQYKGDTDAICTLVDLETAIESANLTDRQRQAITLVYGEDMTQKVAGERMGIERSALTEHLKTAIDEIDAVYESWAWINGDLTEGDYNDEDDTAISA